VLENLDRERSCRSNVLQTSYQEKPLSLEAGRPKYDFAKDRVWKLPHSDLDFAPPAPVLIGHSENHRSELRIADVESEVDLCYKAGMLGRKTRYLWCKGKIAFRLLLVSRQITILALLTQACAIISSVAVTINEEDAE
jgi:hypothetical protein